MGPRARGYKEEPAPVAGDPVSHVKIILYTLVFIFFLDLQERYQSCISISLHRIILALVLQLHDRVRLAAVALLQSRT